jgi:hypothetical protein
MATTPRAASRSPQIAARRRFLLGGRAVGEGVELGEPFVQPWLHRWNGSLYNVPMRRVGVAAIVILLVSACKSENQAQGRVGRRVESKRFWVGAPTPRKATGARELKYIADNLMGYDIKHELSVRADIASNVHLSVAFEPGTSPHERKALLRALVEDIRAPRDFHLRLVLEDDKLSMDLGQGAVHLKRGDGKAITLPGAAASFEMDRYSTNHS